MTENRINWKWKTHIQRLITEGWDEHEAFFAEDRKSIATAISAPGRAVALATGIEGVYSYYARLATKQIAEGAPTGWETLVVSCKLLQLATRLGVTIVQSGNKYFDIHLWPTVNSFFGAFAIGDLQYSDWCARHLVSSLESGVYGLHSKYPIYPWNLHGAYTLAVSLAATYLGLPYVPRIGECAKLGAYEAVVSAMASQTIPANAMNALCDAHLADLRKSDNVFGPLPFALWPAEVFAVQDVAQRAGVSVELDMSHPLLATPFARRPTPAEAACDPPGIDELEAYCAREFPEAA